MRLGGGAKAPSKAEGQSLTRRFFNQQDEGWK